MFRIECFVDDTKLVSVLYALSGKVKAMDVQPVVNVAVEANGKSNGKGKEKLKALTDGRLIDLFAHYLETHQGKVDAKYVKDFLESVGRARTSHQYILGQALEAKMLTKHGPRHHMTYERTKAK
jgi:hypothetical protein